MPLKRIPTAGPGGPTPYRAGESLLEVTAAGDYTLELTSVRLPPSPARMSHSTLPSDAGRRLVAGRPASRRLGHLRNDGSGAGPSRLEARTTHYDWVRHARRKPP